MNTHRLRILALSLAVVLVAPVMHARTAMAQRSACEALHCIAASEALTLFAEEAKELRSDRGHAAVLYILTNPQAVPASRRDSVASGLEQMIVGSEIHVVRSDAAMFLTAAGSADFPTPLRDASRRVVRVYRQTGDSAVRAHLLEMMSQLSDRQSVIPLLREVATQPGDRRASPFDHDADDPELAVAALARMGEEGRAELRELHRSKAVKEPARGEGAGTPVQA